MDSIITSYQLIDDVEFLFITVQLLSQDYMKFQLIIQSMINVFFMSVSQSMKTNFFWVYNYISQ